MSLPAYIILVIRKSFFLSNRDSVVAAPRPEDPLKRPDCPVGSPCYCLSYLFLFWIAEKLLASGTVGDTPRVRMKSSLHVPLRGKENCGRHSQFDRIGVDSDLRTVVWRNDGENKRKIWHISLGRRKLSVIRPLFLKGALSFPRWSKLIWSVRSGLVSFDNIVIFLHPEHLFFSHIFIMQNVSTWNLGYCR